MIWAGCTPASAQNDQSGAGQTQVENSGVQDNGVRNQNAPGSTDTQEVKDTPEVQGTPDASSTQESKGDQKVTGTIQALDGNTVTIDGVQYTVKDASLLAGLKVGDTISFQLHTEDNGTVLVIQLAHGENNGQGTPGATEDISHSGTLEATDAQGMSTLEATDDHGMGTPQATEDTSGGETGGSGGGSGGGGNGGGGGKNDGGGHK